MKTVTKPFRSIRDYLVGSYQEFRRVTWPSREKIMQYTILVTSSIVIATLVLMVFDYGMQQLVDRYLIR